MLSRSHTKQHSEISFHQFVVTLSGVSGTPAGKLEDFFTHYEKTCGREVTEEEITPVRGSYVKRRGEGVTLAFLEILRQRKEDFIIVYEDDARATTSLVCDHNFLRKLMSQLPKDIFALLFSAHDVTQNGKQVHTTSFSFQPVQFSLGAYAWLIPSKNVDVLTKHWESQLLSTVKTLDPDVDLPVLPFKMSQCHNRLLCWKQRVKPYQTYLLEFPHLWVHPASYSATWKRIRNEVDDISGYTLAILDKNGSLTCQVLADMRDQFEGMSTIISLQFTENAFSCRDKQTVHVSIKRNFQDVDLFQSLMRHSTSSNFVLLDSPLKISPDVLRQFLRACDQYPYNLCINQMKQDLLPTETYVNLCNDCGSLKIYRRQIMHIYSEWSGVVRNDVCDRIRYSMAVSYVTSCTAARISSAATCLQKHVPPASECDIHLKSTWSILPTL